VNPLGQYRALGHAGTADLAKAAARRTGRVLRNALSRPAAPLEERALLAAFGVEEPASLAERIFARPNVIADVASLRIALARAPEARARALLRAEAAASQRFQIFGQEVSFEGREIDWSYDAGCGRSYARLRAGDPALLQAGMDPKYPWALGRMEQALALGQGFIASDESAARARFSQAFVAQVRSFLDANPMGLGVHWITPMEVALRAANLAIALLMFEGAEAVGAPAFLLRLLGALGDHARFVAEHLEDQGAVPNNHLVANYVGLFVVSALFPELPLAPRHAALAVHGLRRELEDQVLADGYAFEGSVPYHRLSTELFTLALMAAGRQGFELGKGYTARLQRMFEVAAAYCSECGLAPQVGDNDSGRALPFADRPSLEHGYLASLGAALFNAPSLKQEGAPFCDEALWLLGDAGRWAYDQLAAHRPPPCFSSREGGLHVLRVADAVLTVCAGPKGQRGVGGHNHHDQLSFELHVGGVPVVVDPGTGQYTRDPEARNRLREASAHNTLSVDGRPLGPLDPRRLFALPDPHPAQVLALTASERLARVEVQTHAFAPVTVTRAFLLDGQARALGVVDRFEGRAEADGAHRVTSWLHFPDPAVAIRPATHAERMRAQQVPFGPRSLAEQALVLGPAETPRAVVLFEEGTAVRLLPSLYSAGYGEQREARAVALEWSLRLPARAAWVVLWADKIS